MTHYKGFVISFIHENAKYFCITNKLGEFVSYENTMEEAKCVIDTLQEMSALEVRMSDRTYIRRGF